MVISIRVYILIFIFNIKKLSWLLLPLLIWICATFLWVLWLDFPCGYLRYLKKNPKAKIFNQRLTSPYLGCTMEIWLLCWTKKHLTCLPFLLICKTCYFAHDIVAHLWHLNMYSLNDMCPLWLMLYLMHLLNVNTRNLYLVKHWHSGWHLHYTSLYLMWLSNDIAHFCHLGKHSSNNMCPLCWMLYLISNLDPL